ncbi:tetratricopeptide repeat protein [Candidatus Neptunochlamydia vexilliferae]|nr:tetratricopeptide repeat protein [Candidatus Neptunochlamydia vexilliferae]
MSINSPQEPRNFCHSLLSCLCLFSSQETHEEKVPIINNQRSHTKSYEVAKHVIKNQSISTSFKQKNHLPLSQQIRSNTAKQSKNIQLASSSTKKSSSAPDTAGILYKSLEEAFEKNNPQGQIEYLNHLGRLALSKKNHLRAANLFNAAFSVAKRDLKQDCSYKTYLKNLEDVERHFLEKNYGIDLCLYDQHAIRSARKSLQKIREKVRDTENKNYIKVIQKYLTDEYQNILRSFFDEAFKLFGPPPTSFSVIALGSMSRKEMCPYSDVEFAILTRKQTQETKNYFRKVSLFLELRFVNLGESKWNIIRPKRQPDGSMREPISLIPEGFSMDIGGLSPNGKKGVYDLIGNTKSLARFQNPKWLQVNKAEIILANAMATTSHIMGDIDLTKEYQNHVKRWLDQSIHEKKIASSSKNKGKTTSTGKKALVRKRRAIDLLKGHVEEFRPYLDDSRVEERAFNVKKDLYRPIQMALGSLYLYYDLKSTNSFDRLKELEQRGIFSKEGAKNLLKALEMILKLRMQCHLFYKQEKEFLYRSRGEKDDLAKGLLLIGKKESNVILEIYKILIPLHLKMKAFVENPIVSLADVSFYDEKVGKITPNAENTLDLEIAETSYMQVAAFRPDDPEALDNLQRVKLTVGEALKAVNYNKERLRVLKKSHNNQPHPSIAACLTSLGGAYHRSGQLELALSSHKKSLSMCEKIFGDTPDSLTIGILQNLGYVLKDLGNPKEGLVYYTKALKMAKQLHLKDSLIVTILQNMGAAHRALGEPQKALDLYSQTLDKFQKLTDKNYDIEISHCLNNMGTASYDLKNYKKALDFHKESLSILKKIFKDRDHPMIAGSLKEIGIVYLALEEPQKAEDYLKNGLIILKRVFQDKPHPSLAYTLNNLSYVQSHLGNKIEAAKYGRQAYKIATVVFGDSHPATQQIKKNFELSEKEALEEEIKRASNSHGQSSSSHQKQTVEMVLLTHLKELISKYGDVPDPNTAEILRELGTMEKNTGTPQKALFYYEKSLDMLKKLHGNSDHIEVAKTLNQIGLAHASLGDQKSAITFLKEAVKMKQVAYRHLPHIDTANSLNNLGGLLLVETKPKEALNYLSKALKMLQAIYQGKANHEEFGCLKNMGEAYKSMKDYIKARNYFEKAVRMHKACFGNKPTPHIVQALLSIGMFSEMIKDPEKAFEAYRQGLITYTTLYGEQPQHNLFMLLNGIGSAAEDLGKKKMAAEYSIKAHDTAKKVFGPNHPITELARKRFFSLNGIIDLGNGKIAINFDSLFK